MIDLKFVWELARILYYVQNMFNCIVLTSIYLKCASEKKSSKNAGFLTDLLNSREQSLEIETERAKSLLHFLWRLLEIVWKRKTQDFLAKKSENTRKNYDLVNFQKIVNHQKLVSRSYKYSPGEIHT